MTTTADPGILYTPPGFDLGRLLAKINNPSIEASREWRWRQCAGDPILFALIYFPHLLRSPETGERMSLNDLHIDLARYALEWMRAEVPEAERRHAWIAPRGAGKSMWAFVILPIWALAFGHRRLVAIFSHSSDQAARHMATVRHELDTNPLLNNDFPGLCRPARIRGNTAVQYVSRSGGALVAKGIDAQSLGLNINGNRPDLIIFDDIEPDEGNYSAREKAKRLATVQQGILGMNDKAAVWFVGTVTMRGSIIHDIVETHIGAPVKWVREEQIVPHYYKPIITDPDGTERSLWPQRWSLEYLWSIAHKRSFKVNFMNQPPDVNEGYWTERDIRLGVVTADDWVLAIDPAVTVGEQADYTGLAVVGHSYMRRCSMVESAEGRKLSPAELKEHVVRILELNDFIDKVVIEVNQGGAEVWAEILGKVLPRGVKLITTRADKPKYARFTQLHEWYQDDHVVHSRELPELTKQLLTYPNVRHDDVIDAVDIGVRYFRERTTTR